MTLQQLKYADAVAECGSISEAARRCFVTQPTLTEAIRTLEEELRIAIFTRSAKGVAVTREGDEFLASARQILDDAVVDNDKYALTELMHFLMGYEPAYNPEEDKDSYSVEFIYDTLQYFGLEQYMSDFIDVVVFDCIRI